ncbi:MAG: ComEA family DNA-binding protein [Candidatus Aminicenantaceae bacterium]|jgi:comEA protein
MKSFDWKRKTSVVGILAVFTLVLLAPAHAWAQDKAQESKININTASVSELQELPRIGEQVAQRIVDYREKNGQFKRIEELMKIKGIGEKTFLQLKDKVTVGNSNT